MGDINTDPWCVCVVYSICEFQYDFWKLRYQGLSSAILTAKKNTKPYNIGLQSTELIKLTKAFSVLIQSVSLVYHFSKTLKIHDTA